MLVRVLDVLWATEKPRDPHSGTKHGRKDQRGGVLTLTPAAVTEGTRHLLF